MWGEKGQDGGFDMNNMLYICLKKHRLACYMKIKLLDDLKNRYCAVTPSDLSIPIHKLGKGYYKIWKSFK